MSTNHLAREAERSAAWRVALAGCLAAFTSTACIGSIGDSSEGSDGPNGNNPSGGGPIPGVETEGLEPEPAHLRRLLSRQYANSIADLLGDAAALVAEPPSDTALNGFDSIAAAQLALGDDAVQKYETSAMAVAAAAMGDQANIDGYLGCSPTGAADVDCHRSFVKTFGRLAFRRTLLSEEVEAYTTVAQAAATEYDDFYAGVEWAIAGLIQSPNFLYQVEVGDAIDGIDHARRLSSLEVATRLSFFLLDTTPSADLLDAAEAGDLDDKAGIAEVARGLMDGNDAARAALNSFYSEVFGLRDLGAMVKDTAVYSQFTPALAEAMKQETLALIEDLVWERDTDFRELLSADYTFVNAELAQFYGMSPPEGDGFVKVDLPAEQGRAGLLGQASFLSLFSHISLTSPTLRGKFVRERLLCQSIPAPPNDVDFELPSDEEAKTMKQKLQMHQENPSCAGCHVLMDGIGLSMEHFDGVGAFREMDNGETLDVTGEIEAGKFEGVAELGSLLAQQDQVAACFVRNFYRQATAHVETKGEAPAIEELVGNFDAGEYRVQDLLVALVASDAFRFVGVEQ
ncbi:MAG: DUF1592 domain-containing protein [Polyangiaceae bacterium]